MYSTIIHATDLQDDHYSMCTYAKEFADKFGAKLYLIHVIQPPTSLQLAQSLGFAEFDRPVQKDALSVMHVIAEGLSLPKENVMVEIGSIKSHLLKAINDLGAELIILGKGGHEHLPNILGSTAHAITQQAPCHVLTINK